MLPEFESRAEQICGENHQGNAPCVIGKIKSLGTQNRMMDFESRTMMLEKIRADCNGRDGVCVGARTAQIICRDVTPRQVMQQSAPTSPVAAGAPAQKGKAGTSGAAAVAGNPEAAEAAAALVADSGGPSVPEKQAPKAVRSRV